MDCGCGHGLRVSPWSVCQRCLDRLVIQALERLSREPPPPVVSEAECVRKSEQLGSTLTALAVYSKEEKRAQTLIAKARLEGRYDPRPLPLAAPIVEGPEPGFVTTGSFELVPSGGAYVGYSQEEAQQFWQWLRRSGWIPERYSWERGAR